MACTVMEDRCRREGPLWGTTRSSSSSCCCWERSCCAPDRIPMGKVSKSRIVIVRPFAPLMGHHSMIPHMGCGNPIILNIAMSECGREVDAMILS